MLCGYRGAFDALYEKEGYSIETCPECRLTQVHPAPSPGTLTALYEEGYFSNRASLTGYDDYREQEREYEASFKEEVARIRRIVSSGRVLDVGCGYGYFLQVAAAAGYQAYGIDVAAEAVEEAGRRLPGQVFQGDVCDCPQLGTMQFDVIFVSHLIEHIAQPVDFVTALRKRLAKNGVLVLVTPNIRSLLARISRARWVSLKIPEHVAYYSPATVRRLLQRCGLEAVGVETAHQYYSVPFVAEKLRALFHPFSLLMPPVERLSAFRTRIVRISNGSMRVIARQAPEEGHTAPA